MTRRKNLNVPSLDQDVVTLAKIDLNNNVKDSDSNINHSKERKSFEYKFELSLNTNSDGA